LEFSEDEEIQKIIGNTEDFTGKIESGRRS
jgi:hypothetical protein